MKSILTTVLLIVTVIAIYAMTIGATDGIIERFPETGERISRSVETLDP